MFSAKQRHTGQNGQGGGGGLMAAMSQAASIAANRMMEFQLPIAMCSVLLFLVVVSLFTSKKIFSGRRNGCRRYKCCKSRGDQMNKMMMRKNCCGRSDCGFVSGKFDLVQGYKCKRSNMCRETRIGMNILFNQQQQPPMDAFKGNSRDYQLYVQQRHPHAERFAKLEALIQTAPTKAQEFETRVKEIMSNYNVPGAIASVRCHAKEVMAFNDNNPVSIAEIALGYARVGELTDVEKQRMMCNSPGSTIDEVTPVKMSMDLCNDIGSCSKSMTATLILLAVISGWLSLYDTIDNWFPQLENSNKVTVLNLLSMTSGLGNYGNNESFEKIFLADPYVHWNVADLVRWGKEQPIAFQPGESWQYNNLNYVLLGLMAEMIYARNAEGSSLAPFVEGEECNPNNIGGNNRFCACGDIGNRKKIPLPVLYKKVLFEPLGMTRSKGLVTGFDKQAPHPQTYAEFRNEGDRENTTYQNVNWGFATGSVQSCVDDMHAWAYNIGTVQLLRRLAHPAYTYDNLESVKATHKHLQQVIAAGGDASSVNVFEEGRFYYGLGVAFDHRIMYHNGNKVGSECIFAYYAPLDLTIVIFVNQSTPDRFRAAEIVVNQILRAFTEIYTPDSPLEKPPH